MRTEDKIIYLDRFFQNFKNYERIHIKEIPIWVGSMGITPLDRNNFYDLRRTILGFLDYDISSTYELNIEKIINFYQKTKPNKQEEKFWLKKQGKDSNE